MASPPRAPPSPAPEVKAATAQVVPAANDENAQPRNARETKATKATKASKARKVVRDQRSHAFHYWPVSAPTFFFVRMPSPQ